MVKLTVFCYILVQQCDKDSITRSVPCHVTWFSRSMFLVPSYVDFIVRVLCNLNKKRQKAKNNHVLQLAKLRHSKKKIHQAENKEHMWNVFLVTTAVSNNKHSKPLWLVVCDFSRKYETNKTIRHSKYKRNTLHSHYCRGKAISITYAECVLVALVIQHGKRMRRIMSSLACLTVPYFSGLSHKRHDFRKKLLNIKCLFWFSLQLLSEIFLILRRIQRDAHRSSCYVATRYSYHILMKLALSGQIFF